MVSWSLADCRTSPYLEAFPGLLADWGEGWKSREIQHLQVKRSFVTCGEYRNFGTSLASWMSSLVDELGWGTHTKS